jgi:hypothetical protein
MIPVDDPRLVATTDLVRAHFLVGPACVDDGDQPSVSLTAQLALVEIAAGDRRACERVAWLLDAATPTWTWPAADADDDLRVAAEVLAVARHLLVDEQPDGVLALLPVVADDWLGQGVEVHDAPTHAGRLSYAVRWHGERPAILWELRPHVGVSPTRITAPGLDRSWSTNELSGEVLLGPVSPPAVPTQVALAPRRRPS